jgi:hypothetical protein
MLQHSLFLARDMSSALSTAAANWLAILNHQILLAFKFSSDPSIGHRALQCIAPPILSLILSLLLLALLVARPQYFYIPLFKVFRLLPWVFAFAALAGLGLVLKPAVLDHQCHIRSFEIRPSNRPQWEKIWKEINPKRPDETLWKYRNRMDVELDTWEKRELHEDDLEDWVNLSAKAVAKKNCLDEKSKIVKQSYLTVRQDIQKRAERVWPTKTIQTWQARLLMDCDVCKPVQRKRSWSSMVMTARKATGSSG